MVVFADVSVRKLANTR